MTLEHISDPDAMSWFFSSREKINKKTDRSKGSTVVLGSIIQNIANVDPAKSCSHNDYRKGVIGWNDENGKNTAIARLYRQRLQEPMLLSLTFD